MNLIRNILFVYYLLLNISGVFCQLPSYNYKYLFDESSTIFRNLSIMDDSLLITGEIGIDNSGVSGIFLLKLDSLGEVINIEFLRDTSFLDHLLLDGKNPVIVDGLGNHIMAGHFLAQDDLFIIEIGPKGLLKNYFEYESHYHYLLANRLIKLDSSYYVIGTVQTQNFDLDIFVQKIDHLGNKVWEKNYGTQERDELGFSAISQNGGLTIMITESFDPSPVIMNNTRYWIRFMHIDTSGAIKRDWKEEVTGHEGWSGTLLKYQNDYIYTTNTIGEETNFGPLTGGQIVRRDSAFNIVWRKPLGTPDSQFSGLGDMIFSKDSCLLVTGQNVDSSNQYNAARIMKINLDGELLWEVRDTGISLPNGQSLNIMEGITQSGSGSIYAVGYTYRTANFYEGLLLKVSSDGCIDTICTTTAINDYLSLEKTGILAYPNPVSTYFTIKVSSKLPKDGIVSIYNQQGVEILRESIYSDLDNIDTSTWNEGLYLVNIHLNGQMLASKKIIKIASN